MEDTHSARALVAHWDWASERGLLKSSIASALSAACRTVLEAQEGWESLDVRALDVDDAFSKFNDLRSEGLKPSTIRLYGSRFRRAVESYLEYIDDPAAWKYRANTRTVRASRPSPRPDHGRPDEPEETASAAQPDDMGAPRQQDDLEEYRYPIRADRMARLCIPRDATAAEISRLIAWARTLAVDFEP